jgi:hypothetical protein
MPMQVDRWDVLIDDVMALAEKVLSDPDQLTKLHLDVEELRLKGCHSRHIVRVVLARLLEAA